MQSALQGFLERGGRPEVLLRGAGAGDAATAAGRVQQVTAARPDLQAAGTQVHTLPTLYNAGHRHNGAWTLPQHCS